MGDKRLVIPDTFSESAAAGAMKAIDEEGKKDQKPQLIGISNNNVSEGNQSFAGHQHQREHNSNLESPSYLKIFVSLVVNHGFGTFTEIAENKLVKIMRTKLVLHY